MSKEAVFTMKLEPELRADFMAAAGAVHQPASQIVREMMREFVEREREMRNYEAFLQRKVELAREDVAAGRMLSNEEVQAKFAALRTEVKKL